MKSEIVKLCATVIKQNSVCNGRPIFAWYVRHDGKIIGQFQSEMQAIGHAMESLVTDCGNKGVPLDASTLHDCVEFELNTAYQNP